MTTLKFPQCFTRSSFTPRKKYSCIHTRTFVKTVEILEQQLFCIIPYPSICHIIPGFSFNMNHQAKVGSNSLRDRRKKGVGGRGKIRERKGKGSLPSLPKSSQSPTPFDTCHCQARPTLAGLLGSLSNDDGDRNEDEKKAIGLDWQNNNFARASHFFAHFFAVAARLQSESA